MDERDASFPPGKLEAEAQVNEPTQIAASDQRPWEFKPGNPWRFQRGVSGNPSGRPANVSLEALIREELEESVKGDPIAGRTKARIIATQLVNKAMRGEMRAILAVMDLDGLRRSRIEIDHYDESESLTDLTLVIVDETSPTHPSQPVLDHGVDPDE